MSGEHQRTLESEKPGGLKGVTDGLYGLMMHDLGVRWSVKNWTKEE